MRRQYTFNTGETMYHLEIRHAHPNVITAGSPGRIRRMAQYLDNAEVIESDRGLVTVHGEYRGMPVTAVSTGMGSASVSITLPEVIEACDADKMNIIRLGTSGGFLNNQQGIPLKVGDLVVTTDVQRAESTSDKSMGPDYKASASSNVVHALYAAAGTHRLVIQGVYKGVNRTTDDIYFDAKKSQELARAGHVFDTLTVSMEASVHFALRDAYNRDQNRQIQAGELLVVSDVISAEGHLDMTEFLRNKEHIERAHVLAGLDALLQLR